MRCLRLNYPADFLAVVHDNVDGDPAAMNIVLEHMCADWKAQLRAQAMEVHGSGHPPMEIVLKVDL